MSTEFPPPALKAAAQELAAVLKERNETISVAETAAGGLISASLLATPGASKIYKGGATVSAFVRGWSGGGYYYPRRPPLVIVEANDERRVMKERPMDAAFREHRKS
jgi:hypothetical protein